MKIPTKLIGFVLVGLLVGCASHPPPAPVAEVKPPIRLTAVGYGAENIHADYTPGQRKLMAIRAAKVESYRALAEQVYGLYVSGHSNISSAVMQNDSARTYVNSFVRGAKVLEITPSENHTYEVTTELMLDGHLADCLSNQSVGGCPQLAPPPYYPGYVSGGSSFH